VSEKVTKCLLNALDVINQSSALDPASKRFIVDDLEQLINNQSRSDRTVLAKTAYLMRAAKQRTFIQIAAKAGDEVANKGLAANGGNGWSFTQMFRNLIGNRGNVNFQSVASQAAFHFRDMGNKLNPVWDVISDYRLTQGIKDSEWAQAFVIRAEGGEVADPALRAAVDLYHAELTPWLKRLRNAGVWVEGLNNYFPHSWKMSRIDSDPEFFNTEFAGVLDPAYHPDPQATTDAVKMTLQRAEYESASGQTITMARKLHFKSPEDAARMFALFGNGSVSENVLRSMENIIFKTLMAERFGPNALDNIKLQQGRLGTKLANQKNMARSVLVRGSATAAERAALLKTVVEAEGGGRVSFATGTAEERAIKWGKATDEKLAKQVEKITKESDRLIKDSVGYAEFSLGGGNAQPVNMDVANYFSTARNFLSGTFLGKVILAQNQDLINSIVQSRFHTGGYGSAFSGQLRALKEVVTDADLIELATNYGLFQHVYMANARGRMASTNDLNIPQARGRDSSGLTRSEKAAGRAARYATFMQRFTVQQQAEQGMRAAHGMLVSRAMMKMQRKSWDQLPARYRKVVLENNGIGKREWAGFQAQGKAFKGTEAIDLNSLPTLLRERFGTAIVREAELAVTFPTTYDRYLINFGQKGTYSGEVAQTLGQFMSWGTSFTQNSVAREIQAGGSGAIGAAGAMVGSGVLTTQLYAMVGLEPTYELDSPELWMRAMGRSGLLTPIGEVALRTLGSGRSQGPLASPVVDVGVDLARSFTKAGMDAMDGEYGKAAASLGRSVYRNLAPNYAFTVGLTNKAMDYAMEPFDPGYAKRRDKRREEARTGGD